MFCSVFSPKCGRPRILPALAAFSRSPCVFNLMCLYKSLTILGPIPSMRVSSSMSTGIFSRSPSYSLIFPVLIYSSILSAIPLPTPGIPPNPPSPSFFFFFFLPSPPAPPLPPPPRPPPLLVLFFLFPPPPAARSAPAGRARGGGGKKKKKKEEEGGGGGVS